MCAMFCTQPHYYMVSFPKSKIFYILSFYTNRLHSLGSTVQPCYQKLLH